MKKFVLGLTLILALVLSVAAFADGLTPLGGEVLSGALSVIGADSIDCDPATPGFGSVTLPCTTTGAFRVGDTSQSQLGSHLNILLDADLTNGTDTISADNLDAGLSSGYSSVVSGQAEKPIARNGFVGGFFSVGLLGVSPTTCPITTCNGVYDVNVEFQLTYDLPLSTGIYSSANLISQNLSGP